MDDEGVSVEKTPELSADLTLSRSVIEDARSVSGDGVSTHALTTWTEHEMAMSAITEQASESLMNGDEEGASQVTAPIALLSNPFNKSVFSSVFVYGYGQGDEVGLVSPARATVWASACEMALAVIQGDEETIGHLRSLG